MLCLQSSPYISVWVLAALPAAAHPAMRVGSGGAVPGGKPARWDEDPLAGSSSLSNSLLVRRSNFTLCILLRFKPSLPIPGKAF
jgi:hypothetical protein